MLTLNFWLAVAFLAAVPFWLAAYAGHVAAESINDPNHRLRVRLNFWSISLVGLLVAFAYQYRTTKSDEKRQQETDAWQKGVTAQLDEIIKHPVSEKQKQAAMKLKREVNSFLQFSDVVLNRNYSEIVPGGLLGMNIGFIGKVKPVHDAYTYMKLAVVDLTPTGQASFLSMARETTKKEHGEELKRRGKGKDVGIDDVLWDTIKVGPLDDETTKRLLEGRSLIYVYGWATWKDPQGNVGMIEACRWLQPPRSNHLRQDDMVWQVCQE